MGQFVIGALVALTCLGIGYSLPAIHENVRNYFWRRSWQRRFDNLWRP